MSDFYADYSTFHVSGKSKNENEPMIQTDSYETKRNKIGIHFKKTTTIIVGTKQKLCDTEKLNITIDNHNIEAVCSQKLLGIHIDENLNWTRYIDHLCATISTRISLLKQLSSYTPENIHTLFTRAISSNL